MTIEQIQEYLALDFLGNTVQQYLIALGVFYVTLMVLLLFRGRMLAYFDRLSKKTSTLYDDLVIFLIQSLGSRFYIVVSVLVGLHLLNFPEWFEPYFYSIKLAVSVFYVVRVIQAGVSFFIEEFIHKAEKESKNFDPSILQFLGLSLKGVVLLLGLLIILQNLGFNVTALVGGLGIGGIAIAFALQNVLSDIFASLSIFFDKPFKTGDFIVLGTDMGTVQKIGIRSTRIKTLQGEALVVSNQELTTARVQNFKQLDKRRIVFTLNLVYNTTSAKMEKALKIIEEVVNAEGAQTELDRTHFSRFAASSLDIETVYHVTTGDFQVYMDEQQRINFAIKKAFEKEKIEFAYPTQTVHIEK